MSITVQSPAFTAHASGEDRLRKQRLLHDIRQSLTAVMSLAAIVEKSLDRGPEVLKRLDQIREEADWMTRLVSSAGPRARDDEVLDVGDVVAAAWSAVAATSSCAIQLVRDARACACVDRDELARSVRNLLDNAVRAAGDDGTVVVHVRAETDTVAVVVRDDGPGFGNIPGQQGLGLATVRRFAAENGAQLEVGNAPQGGAELTLRMTRVAPLLCTPRRTTRCES
jgi:signal transduction histidine kinase